MADHAGGGGEGTQLDHILVAMEAGRDRELLTSWLRGFPQYEITIATDSSEIPETYDLCLLDPASLDGHRDVIEGRTEAAAPAYLPHVLLLAGDQHTDRDHEQIVATETAIDEVLALPMEKDLLRQRLENLLRARRSSVKLSSREKQYRTLLQVLPEMVLLVDAGEIVYANETATRELTDNPSGSLDGHSLDTFVTDESRKLLHGVLESASEEARSTATDFVSFTMVSATGRELPVEATGLNVTFEGRQVTQLIVRNMTTQKQREKQLNLFGRAIESAVQGITIADAQQEDEPLVYANAAFEEITGYSIDDALGRNCRFLQGPNTDQDAVRRLRRGVKNAQPVSVDILNYRKDETAFWNRVDIVPIKDDSGTVTHFLGLQQDISESKQSKQRLSVLNRILRHNLRNKVNVIQAHTERIENDEGDTAEAIESIRGAAAALLDVGERAREFDSVISGSNEEMDPIDLVAVVDKHVTALQTDAPDADVSMTAPESAPIAAHPGLRTALGDLFVQLGTPAEPSVSVTISRDDKTVTMRLTDRGGALSAHDLEIVGYDVETPTEHLQGVGLWLLRWAVEHSRGEMHADTDGEFPTIELRFPTRTEPA
jgi:PAS domain S-box-containing protein